jgi:hypothetical protein
LGKPFDRLTTKSCSGQEQKNGCLWEERPSKKNNEQENTQKITKYSTTEIEIKIDHAKRNRMTKYLTNRRAEEQMPKTIPAEYKKNVPELWNEHMPRKYQGNNQKISAE